MLNFFRHLHTVNKHRFLVSIMCFKCGMYYQGLTHDLSKYSPSEFIPSVKYFQGFRSPITYEKETFGYSLCWLHHKGRNKHHWEYWTDRIGTQLVTIPVPFNYMLEMVIDKISASKVYMKNKYTDGYPITFFKKSKEIGVMNPITAKQVEELLTYLAINGEKNTLKYIKTLYKNWKKDNNFTI